jgi:hypothetical protein
MGADQLSKECNSNASRHHTARADGSIYAEKATICRGLGRTGNEIHHLGTPDRAQSRSFHCGSAQRDNAVWKESAKVRQAVAEPR